MNTIFIADLRVETRIGVYDWEQQLKQPLLLNVDIEPGSAAALASDRFADALDYAAVVARLKSFAAEHQHKLLERFAAALADLVREEFGARWVRVSVAKPAPIPGVRQIGVVVERGERSA
jgi:dihydroneopterin aldolase